MTEGGGRKREDGGWKREDGGQITDDGGQMTEDGGWRMGDNKRRKRGKGDTGKRKDAQPPAIGSSGRSACSFGLQFALGCRIRHLFYLDSLFDHPREPLFDSGSMVHSSEKRCPFPEVRRKGEKHPGLPRRTSIGDSQAASFSAWEITMSSISREVCFLGLGDFFAFIMAIP